MVDPLDPCRAEGFVTSGLKALRQYALASLGFFGLGGTAHYAAPSDSPCNNEGQCGKENGSGNCCSDTGHSHTTHGRACYGVNSGVLREVIGLGDVGAKLQILIEFFLVRDASRINGHVHRGGAAGQHRQHKAGRHKQLFHLVPLIQKLNRSQFNFL